MTALPGLAELVPSDRDLSCEELALLAAAVPSLVDVEALAEFHPGRRHYTRLWHDDFSEAWLICWQRDNDTGFHDHDRSSGAVHVVRGSVSEERPVIGSQQLSVSQTYVEGDTLTFDGCHIHRMRHAGEVPAVTIHVYSPPVATMGAYEIAEGGVLRRAVVPGDVELKPGIGQPAEPELAVA